MGAFKGTPGPWQYFAWFSILCAALPVLPSIVAHLPPFMMSLRSVGMILGVGGSIVAACAYTVLAFKGTPGPWQYFVWLSILCAALLLLPSIVARLPPFMMSLRGVGMIL